MKSQMRSWESRLDWRSLEVRPAVHGKIVNALRFFFFKAGENLASLFLRPEFPWVDFWALEVPASIRRKN